MVANYNIANLSCALSPTQFVANERRYYIKVKLTIIPNDDLSIPNLQSYRRCTRFIFWLEDMHWKCEGRVIVRDGLCGAEPPNTSMIIIHFFLVLLV